MKDNRPRLPCGCPIPAVRKEMCEVHKAKLDAALKKIREKNVLSIIK
jgi:hypothetical protein